MYGHPSTPGFILELPLCVDSKAAQCLEKAFEFGRMLCNATLGTVLGQNQAMHETPEWRAACAMPKGKKRTEAFEELSKRFRLSGSDDFEKILQEHARKSGRPKGLHSDIKQTLACDLWRAYSNWRFADGGRPRFKSAGRGLHSLRGKKSITGIIWKPETRTVVFSGHALGTRIKSKDWYARQALADPIDPTKPRKVRYCIIVRRRIRGKTRWYVQLYLEGNPPVRIIPCPDQRLLGIDPSMCNVTIMTEEGLTMTIRTAPKAEDRQDEIRRIQRRMDRSRRAMNPGNYEADGKIKKGRLQWKYSNAYKRDRDVLADIHRIKAATRKCEHGRIQNILLQTAGIIRIEKNDWKAMQKGLFGRSVGKGAPSEFVSKFVSKAERAGVTTQMIDPKVFRPSQHTAVGDKYIKHELWERRVPLGGSPDFYMDRDAAAALNIMCADPGKRAYDLGLLARVVEASKQQWLDAGVVVQTTTSMRASEREFRGFLRIGRTPMPPDAVEKCIRNRFLKSEVTASRGRTGNGPDSRGQAR